MLQRIARVDYVIPDTLSPELNDLLRCGAAQRGGAGACLAQNPGQGLPRCRPARRSLSTPPPLPPHPPPPPHYTHTRPRLCSRMLVREPERRITMLQVLQHPWFLKDLPPDALVASTKVSVCGEGRGGCVLVGGLGCGGARPQPLLPFPRRPPRPPLTPSTRPTPPTPPSQVDPALVRQSEAEVIAVLREAQQSLRHMDTDIIGACVLAGTGGGRAAGWRRRGHAWTARAAPPTHTRSHLPALPLTHPPTHLPTRPPQTSLRTTSWQRRRWMTS